ncbi:MAG: alpha-hydroxy-acid oxidizing protein [Thermoleophilaceae bacterium]
MSSARPGTEHWPASPADWEDRAAAALPPECFDYFAGGSGGEVTLRANVEAFERVRLWPHVLTGNTEPDLSVTLLGERVPAPFLLAPVGVLELAHHDAELAVAHACGALGIPMVTGTAASRPLEDVATALGPTPRWFQLYWLTDREVVASLVRRAEAAGFSAIVLTVDMPVRGTRERDVRNRFVETVTTMGVAQITSDPVFRAGLATSPEDDPEAAAAAAAALHANHLLDWEQLAWLVDATDLPVLVKGVLRPDDAERALAAGAGGVVVSNHGGRQLDGAVASLDALVEVRRALGDAALVLMDGGVRRGADVVKALALGANAVLIGRLYVWALALGGREGVEHLLRSLIADVEVALALVGAGAATGVDESLLHC